MKFIAENYFANAKEIRWKDKDLKLQKYIDFSYLRKKIKSNLDQDFSGKYKTIEDH
jgi:hypothetical protein